MRNLIVCIIGLVYWVILPTSTLADELDRVPSQIQIERLQGGLGAAPPGQSVRQILEIALELLKHFEGWEPEFYDDPAGYCTIGYGHLIALTSCANSNLSGFSPPLSEKAGEELLLSDTRDARYAVQRLVAVDLNHAQFSALSSFVFNVGSENFRKSTLLRLLNQGDYNGSAKQFRRWVKAGGRTLPGLVIRRKCEEALFLGILTFDENEQFDRSRCEAIGAQDLTGDLIDVYEGE